MTLTVGPVATLMGEIRPPSDKSITHRAYMLAAIANGPCLVRRPLRGEDCEATLRCLCQMGLSYAWLTDEDIRLVPAEEWTQPGAPLDCGNSGTTMRLLSGLIASRPLDCTLTGDASLSKRPMRRIAEPLERMGATVEGETPPLRIVGRELNAIDYHSPVASAQVKSCVLLAGLRADGETTVIEPHLSRDHTERMLDAVGVPVIRHLEGRSVSIQGGQRPESFEMTVPGDLSSAAFFMVAAAILPGSDLIVRDVGINPTRSGAYDVLVNAGVNVRSQFETLEVGEPTANLWVRHEPRLQAFTIEGALVPRLIDEIPVLAVLATQCEGTSVIRDARELRVKESDRIERVAEGLRKMGASVETFEDGMAITGPTKLRGTRIEADGDHRIAMAFAIAGMAAEGQTTIDGAEAVATSFPAFEQELGRLCVV